MGAVATREMPILFSGAMVRAIMENRKTQTRRVVKPQPHDGIVLVRAAPGWAQPYVDDASAYGPPVACPYGQPGDRLWVRETFAQWSNRNRVAQYRADVPEDRWHLYTWRPSIFMPRWASRITLEITDVRVECVHDISEADAQAEGMTERTRLPGVEPLYAMTFAKLWNSINAARGYSWESNPWVWAITFKRI